MTNQPWELKAADYLAFVRADEEPSLGSAWEIVQDAVDNEPEDAWKIILAAVDQARDDQDLAFIGTGPLESLLVQHRSFLQRAIDTATRDLKFREALRSADIRGGTGDDVAMLEDFFDRLDAISE